MPTQNEIAVSTTPQGASTARNRTFGQNLLRNHLSFFQRHDSTFSVTDDYEYQSANDLNVWNGAALLCADCLGTGLLALPHDITVVLGSKFGLFFLILQLPINLYAGTILSDAALFVETKQSAADDDVDVVHERGRLLSSETGRDRIRNESDSTTKNYQAVKIDVEDTDDNSLVDRGHERGQLHHRM